MTVEIVLKKQYPKIQDSIAEINQAEGLGFEVIEIRVSKTVTP